MSIGLDIAVAAGNHCPAGDEGPVADFNLPSQPLGQALQALAVQTGLDILFEPATVAGRQARAVRGSMKAGKALCLLLDHSELSYSLKPDRTIVISRRTGDGVAEGPTRSRGDAAEMPAQVKVTGRRYREQSIDHSLVPVDSITGESIAATGVSDTAEALSLLVPSFNYPHPSLASGTDIVRPATLRGLGPDEMLVLVDGKRRHASALLNINTTVGRGSAAVDMSMLPSAAIDRIEVLRDGAGTRYGSDAIAGVVDVLLKERRDGGEVELTYGQTYTTIHGVPAATGIETQPDGEPVIAPDGTYALKYAGDRKQNDGQTVTLSGNFGLPLATDGFLDITVQGRDQEPTNRAGYDPRQQYPALDSGLADPREFTFDRLSQRFGEPRLRDAIGVVNAGLPVGGGAAQWYALGTYGVREGVTEGFYESAVDPLTVTKIYPNGFLPQLEADVDDRALITGLRGQWSRWNYDLSLNYGRNRIDFSTHNTDNVLLGDRSPTSFRDGGVRYQQYLANLDLQRDFALPRLTPALSVAWGLEYRGERYATRPGDPDPVRFIVRYGPSLSKSLVAASEAQGLPEFRALGAFDQSRHDLSEYVDLEQSLNERWTVGVAGRAEQYSDFGATVNYKLATRVVLARGLAGRFSITSGFRAPSLPQEFFSTTMLSAEGGNGVFLGGEVGGAQGVYVRTLPATAAVARALGSQDLKPERSTSFGAGLVFDGVEGLDLTVDWFRVRIDRRIVLSDDLGLEGTSDQNSAVQSLLAESGNGDVSAVRFFINGFDTLTQGVDVASAYRFPTTRWGDVRLSAGYNYTRTAIVHLNDSRDSPASIPGNGLVGPVESGLITHGEPRSKASLSADWGRHGLSATVRANYYGAVLSPGQTVLDNLVIEPAWVADIELRYSYTGWQFALGADNVLDTYPTAKSTGLRAGSVDQSYPGANILPATNYTAPFSDLSPFGFRGRFLYSRVTYRF